MAAQPKCTDGRDHVEAAAVPDSSSGAAASLEASIKSMFAAMVASLRDDVQVMISACLGELQEWLSRASEFFVGHEDGIKSLQEVATSVRNCMASPPLSLRVDSGLGSLYGPCSPRVRRALEVQTDTSVTSCVSLFRDEAAPAETFFGSLELQPMIAAREKVVDLVPRHREHLMVHAVHAPVTIPEVEDTDDTQVQPGINNEAPLEQMQSLEVVPSDLAMPAVLAAVEVGAIVASGVADVCTLKDSLAKIPAPILDTPESCRSRVAVPQDTPRRSERLAQHQKKVARSVEIVAQESLVRALRDLGLLGPKAKFHNEARDKLEKLFQGPLAMQSIQEIQALVKNVNKVKKRGGKGIGKERPEAG